MQRLTEGIAYRGPDGSGMWSDGSVGFGHTMLHTSDQAKKERQPVTLDGRAWVTADIRLDGRQALIRSLRSAGEVPRDGVTDPELVLHGYRAWGREVPTKLLGDFAFGVWDAETKELFCARDHMGVKPFYYCSKASTFAFSNTLNCLRQLPFVSKNLNDLAIADFLLVGWNQDPATTTFLDIQQLPPASSLWLSRGAATVSSYWHLPLPTEKKLRSREEYVDGFLATLREAVADRVCTDSISIFMSGGVDSPAVASIANDVLVQRQSSKPLLAITAVNGADDPEKRFAGLAADRIGIPAEYMDRKSWPYFERWQEEVAACPEPRDDPLYAFTANEYRIASAHGRVLLTGYDGDSLLAPSRRAYIGDLMSRRAYAEFLRNVASFLYSKRRLPKIARRKQSTATDELMRDYYPGWLNPEFEARLGLRQRFAEVMNPPVPPEYHVREDSYAYLTASNWNRLFTDADPGVTAIPLEVRHPMADVRLIEFCMSLPQVPWCLDKYILRETMRERLPAELLARPKTTVPRFPRPSSPQHDALAKALPGVGALSQYVDVRRVPIQSLQGTLETHWLHLRPLQLGHWLVSLEG